MRGLINSLFFVFLLFFFKQSFVFALERTVTVTVIACPHALGLAVPLVVAVSTSIAARNGVLIRNRASFESARKIDTIVFDKTGTLTEGKFGITDTLVYSKDLSEKDLLKYAASVESHSEHPIAKGVVSSVEEVFSVKDFKAIPGKGVEGKVKGKYVKVVSLGYLKENKLNVEDKRIKGLSSQGKTVVFVLFKDKILHFDWKVSLNDIIFVSILQ